VEHDEQHLYLSLALSPFFQDIVFVLVMSHLLHGYGAATSSMVPDEDYKRKENDA
jgi:hypothetical protein